MPEDDTRKLPATELPTDGEDFVSLVFHGERFEGGVIPVEALPELATYRDAVVAAAKGLFRVRHKGRHRVPKGFEASIRLVLAGSVEVGSAKAPVRRIREADEQRSLPVPDEVDEAVDYLEEWFDAAVNGTAFPTNLGSQDQRHVERALASLGRHLLQGEALETRTASRTAGVRYTTEARRRLAERIGRQEIEVDYDSVIGQVISVGITDSGHFFNLDLGELGVHPNISYDSERHDPLSMAAPEGPPIPVTVSFTARIDAKQDLITGIQDISNLTVNDTDNGSIFAVPEEAEYEEALTEFASMKDGWLDGIGRSPTSEALTWASEALKAGCGLGRLPLPWLYPTPEGGIRAEWSIERFRASAVYDPEDDVVRLFRTNVDEDEFQEEELGVADATADAIGAFLRVDNP